MDDSSSESPMEDGSMDGSEHEYDGYDMEADDDEPQDEYDEIPDDDDDMDDDDDSAPFEVPHELQDAMSNIVSQLRVFDGDISAFRAEEVPVDNRTFGLVALDASAAASHFGPEETVRSILENLSPPVLHGRPHQYARHGIAALGTSSRHGGLHFPSLPHIPHLIPMSGRSRGSMWPSDLFRDSDSSDRVHPALHRPDTPSNFSGSSNPRPESVLNMDHIMSRLQASGSNARISAITTINVDFRPTTDASREGHNSNAAFDDALSSVQMLSQLVSSDAVEPVVRPSQTDQANGPRRADPETLPSVLPEGTESSQAQREDEEDQIQPVRSAEPTAQPHAQHSNRQAAPTVTTGPACHMSIITSPVERVSSRGGIPPWAQPIFGNENLMSTMTRHALSDIDSALSFMRRPMVGRMPRERDRASSTRRWTYDPPGNGGDDLPAMFGGEPRTQHSHNPDRRTSSNPFAIVAAESFEPVKKLESKIVSRLAALALELRKIDSTMNKGITEAKKRKEKAEKRSAEEAAKAAAAKADPSASGNDEKPKPPATLPVAEELAAIAERALNEIAGEAPELAPSQESAAAAEGGERSAQANEAAGTEPVAATASEDNAMQSAGESEPPASDVELRGDSAASVEVAGSSNVPVPETDDITVERADPAAAQTGEQTAGATNAQNETANGRPAESTFPTVAAARAAAIGISLDAPASNDPSVVQAALDSTGIDPTFLAALPDEMRGDVLNDHFQRVRSAAPPATEAAETPVTTLNQDFLIALPPELRAEVLEAEAEYEARNSGGANAARGAAGAGNNGGAAGGGSGGGPGAPGEEMDNASFLATLNPELREEILLTAPDTLLASLPPALAAEARTLREREAANRMQSHPWSGGGDEAPVLFRRDMYNNGLSMIRRDREAREGRRESIGMRWEKVDGAWTRVGPKDEDEVKSSLDDDALSSVVQLLRLRQSSFGKTVVFQVLASACKNTKAREKVLTELLAMVTGGTEVKSTPVSDSGVYAAEGTVVRRALELLSQLCKNDLTIAETMIGLASTPSAAKESNSDEIEPVVKSCTKNVLCLSTLTSLLTTPLFTRSNTHLELLLGIISVVCQAFPPSRVGKSKRRRLPPPSALDTLLSRQEILDVEGGDDDDDDDLDVDEARRTLMEQMEEVGIVPSHRDGRDLTAEESVEVAHQLGSFPDFRMRQLFDRRRSRGRGASGAGEAQDSSDSSDGDREGDELRIVIEEGGNAVLEETRAPRDSAPGEGEGAAAPSGEGNAEGGDARQTTGTDKAKKKKEKKKDVTIPVECRVPKLSEADLNALVVVLRKPGCTEWVYDRLSSALGQLGELPSNRSVTVAAIANSAQDLGLQVKKAYSQFKKELEICAVDPQLAVMKRKQSVAKFAMESYLSELTLLRLVKTAATLLDQGGQKEKSETKPGESATTSTEEPKQDPKVVAELRESKERVFRGLQDLWVALNEVLDLVEADVETPGKDRRKGGQIPGTGYPSGARTEGLARMARNRNSRKSLSPVLARLSPIIEAFFIAHSALTEMDAEGSTGDKVASPLPVSPRDSVLSPGPSESIDSKDSTPATKELGRFIERHRVPVNALLRSNPSLLETSFNMALKHSHAIDFDNKKAYFRSLIKKRSSEAHAGTKTVRLQVRRDHVYIDSFSQLKGRSKEEMKGRLHIQFVGEEGIDAGGVTREWYTILARQIFDANYALFCRSAAKAATYQPDKRSSVHSEHLENFKFVGRVIAKAIYDGQLIDAYFTRSFYKHILGVKPTYHDIEAQDPDFYNSLKWILENDITGILDHTMSAEYEEFGRHTVVDLMPNGRNIAVTEENKAEYVRLVTEVRLTKAIEKQIEAFKKGFHELIPLEDCKIFNELELELLMSGLPDIDMADLKANVEYTGYTSSSPQINWFWRCVGKMDQEDLARLVMFVTGTSKVPLEGFSALQGMNGAQKFQIHRIAGDTTRLPSAHTCFNQLDLPEYSSAEVLSERLLRAVRECHVGFGFA